MAHLPPFEVEITGLGPKGIGLGVAPDGRPIKVPFAPPGARVLVLPLGRRKGEWSARRLAIVRPPAGWQVPPCPQFSVCGGCTLQDLTLDAQRAAKQGLVLHEVGPIAPDVTVHPIRGTDAATGYRNKLELTFGSRRWLAESDRGEPIEGRWLGFHAPGRFDRVVDAPTCSLAGPVASRAIAVTRTLALTDESPVAYDPRTHAGFWRHLLLREAAGKLLVGIYTTPADDEQARHVERLALALREDPAVGGVIWMENASVADVARGAVRATWGDPILEERLGTRTFRLATTTFFQTNTAAAAVLYDVIGEAVGTGRTLYDLYCGIGSIGLYLADRFERIVGVEEVEDAVAHAREHAAANGVDASYHAGRMEALLPVLLDDTEAAVVVDPPRAGLHPSVAARLGALQARVLVYVACNAASLGRDRAILEAGGWRLTDLWTVDLFPQTGHVEAVGRFTRGDA